MKYIGIDPGKKTGFAVWDHDAKYLAEVSTMSITQAMEKVRMMADILGRDNIRLFIEDIRRIVAAMDNKGAWRNRSAFCTFTSYVGRDHELLTRRQAEAECGRLYTYLQMVQMLPTNGGRYRAEDFETVQTPQGVRWRIRTTQD